MIRSTTTVLILVGLISSVAGGMAAAATPLERLERSLQSTKDLTAVVLQTRQSPLLEEELRADGKLWIRKPGDVRIEYTTPEPTTLLKQADTTWLYVPALEQVQRTRASNAGIPLEWVLGSSLEEIENMAELEGTEGARRAHAARAQAIGLAAHRDRVRGRDGVPEPVSHPRPRWRDRRGAAVEDPS